MTPLNSNMISSSGPVGTPFLQVPNEIIPKATKIGISFFPFLITLDFKICIPGYWPKFNCWFKRPTFICSLYPIWAIKVRAFTILYFKINWESYFYYTLLLAPNCTFNIRFHRYISISLSNLLGHQILSAWIPKTVMRQRGAPPHTVAWRQQNMSWAIKDIKLSIDINWIILIFSMDKIWYDGIWIFY